MTLNTSMAFFAPVNARELFDEARRLLGRPLDEQYEVPVEPHTIDRGSLRYANHGGQGLPAIVRLVFAVERPIAFFTEGWNPGRDTFALLDWDTSYEHVDERGLRCDELHTFYILKMAEWADERGIEWRWFDEFNGTWKDRDDLKSWGDVDFSKVQNALDGII